jgi:hypothetical protein
MIPLLPIWLNSRADVTNLSLIGSTPQRGINTIEI